MHYTTRTCGRPLRWAALFGCLLWLPFGALARQAPDTTQRTNAAYEAQRNKVNELLDQRSARFGQFNQSLEQRTGIFGLKTKKDMQASIDILKQIVLTDNDIFRETKQLLDFKDFEKTQIAEQASEFDGRINGYIKTISKLQQEQERLQQELRSLQQNNRRYLGLLLLTLAVLVVWAAFIFRRRKKLTKA
ncbi:hypothetical protein [Parapedobacter lycopersici]|uniref:hypothetical protein n=1 Tax=Parapedobacter lycopersici TaxID=1864939 RepID=UPI00214D84B8|nr:hypothetical protein [Parapedobacter lycopersici]